MLNSNHPALEEARRIAGQSRGDKLDGKQGEEAHDIILRLLEETGLDYGEGLALLGAFEWNRWKAGYEAARANYVMTKES